MKITKTTWVAIAVGVVLIGGISLLTALNQQTSQKADLEKRLNEAKQKMALADNDKLIAQRDQLNAQIQDRQAQIASIKARLVYPDDNIEITQNVILNAVNCQVELLDLRSPGPTSEALGGVKYETMSFVINARGTTQKIADFVYSLKKVFPTCIIKSLSLDFTAPKETAPAAGVDPETGEPVETPVFTPGLSTGSDTMVVVSINMVIYNYKGD